METVNVTVVSSCEMFWREERTPHSRRVLGFENHCLSILRRSFWRSHRRKNCVSPALCSILCWVNLYFGSKELPWGRSVYNLSQSVGIDCVVVLSEEQTTTQQKICSYYSGKHNSRGNVVSVGETREINGMYIRWWKIVRQDSFRQQKSLVMHSYFNARGFYMVLYCNLS